MQWGQTLYEDMPNWILNWNDFTRFNEYVDTILPFFEHHKEGVESIERRQQQLGRMADFPPPVTFSVFDL